MLSNVVDKDKGIKMYLISIYFDRQTNKILQRYIDKIADRTDNHFMIDNHVPPHMTIASIEARNIDVLKPAFAALNGKLYSGSMRIVSVGQLFPYVMYAMPVLNQNLFKLSWEVYNAFCDIPETTMSEYYKPFSWLPHITLGKTLDKVQMQKAFQAMQESFIPFTAQFEEIGLAKVNPHEDAVRFKLL